jgi:purine nucleoside phosphorylase
MKLLVIISVGFKNTDQLWKYNETVHRPFIDFKKAYDSVMREVLYSILIELRVLIKLVRLIKMYLNESHSRTHIEKHISDNFSV